MTTIITFFADHIFELLMGGGLITWYMASENKRTIRIDNDRKLLDECYEHLDKMKKHITEMETRYTLLLQQKDARIKELEAKVKALEEELDGMKARRGANGRFVKKQQKNDNN